MPFFASLRTGSFLALRYIRRTSPWTTGLIVFVMALTFMNLVVVTGILVGLVEGSKESFREQYAGDVLVSVLPSNNYIERSPQIINLIESLKGSEVTAYSPRYLASGSIEAHYQRTAVQANTAADTAGGTIAGIDPVAEQAVTNLAGTVVEGRFLRPGEEDAIVVGGNLLERYLPADTGLATVADVYPGDKVRLSVGGAMREMTVVGVTRSKTNEVDLRIFMLGSQLRKLIDRFDFNVDEIAIKVADGAAPARVKEVLLSGGARGNALVRRAEESLGDFLEDIQDTFGTLGNVIGSIGLIVASITIFIVIFIMAVTRQKFIGILKGIGIAPAAIEVSYVLLSLFYALLGIALGVTVTYGVLVPYFAANPIDFPFSDGILVVTPEGTAIRALIVLGATVAAGYIPAKLVVRKPALEAILGR